MAEDQSVAIVRDLIYASPGGRKLCVDLYLPEFTGSARAAIIWLHGGGWRFGDRRQTPNLVECFAARGYCMASIDYRLSRDAVFPAAVEDVKAAIRWLKDRAAIYHIDPDRVGLWGSSAGGHLAALAALSRPDQFQTPGAGDTRIAAVVDAYGPSDFLQMDAHRDPLGAPSDDIESIQLPPGKKSADADSLESLFLGVPIGACPEKVRAADPCAYAHKTAPPFLLLHGLSDTAVPSHQSELLFDALQAVGADVTLGLIPGLGHGFLNRPSIGEKAYGVELRMSCMSAPSATSRYLLDWIGDWFDAHLAHADASRTSADRAER